MLVRYQQERQLPETEQLREGDEKGFLIIPVEEIGAVREWRDSERAVAGEYTTLPVHRSPFNKLT